MRINTKQYSLNFVESSTTEDPSIITFGEFFAGGGGWTSGVEDLPGVKTKWILNHDKVAIKTNAHWHKGVKVYWADVCTQDEHEMDYVDWVHASVDCKYHSRANAGKEKKVGSYTLGWELYRYLKFLKPIVISIENVPEFKKWAPLDAKNKPIKSRQGEEFERWKKAIMDLGYEYKESIRNAADDGLPTRRVRYFAFFHRPGVNVSFPNFTHSKCGTNGKQKWKSCRPHIDTSNEGNSIFGRQFNTGLRKGQRKPLCYKSLRRIAGGIKRLYPQLHQFLAHYYGGENANRFQSLDTPINTIPCENRHQLITVEKLKFIMDHIRTDNYHELDEPMKPQLCWQTKQMTTVNNILCQYYGTIQSQTLDAPINTIPARDVHQLLTIRFEKIQFIATFFNSNGNPGLNTHSLDDPLPPVMTDFKHQLVTLLDDFDIKARFLNPEELGACSTFKRGYFTSPNLKLSAKNAVRLIGNAVPPKWAEKLVSPNVSAVLKYKQNIKAA
ncbi:DNA cytosine methyltransferase [Parapedobacter sp.]|uniref:DNA cytosine methyltransferase n=1 Tax=Parapedobacter sp. TaxID=1958893 RepID=UPI002D7F5477|nr:DNA cytosine methyltransferase [Parapedobacter sp.]